MRAKLVELGIGEEVAYAMLGGVPGHSACSRIGEQHQLLRTLDWKRANHQSVDQAENCSVCAYADRQGHDSDGREHRCLAQDAHPATNIARQILDQTKTASIAALFPYLLQPA